MEKRGLVMDIRGFFSAGAKTAKKSAQESKSAPVSAAAADAAVDLADSDEEERVTSPKK